MNYRLVAATLGALAAAIGICTATAVPWSLYYRDGVYHVFLILAALYVFGGGAIYRVFRDSDAEYGLRDGFAIVTFGWLLSGLLGAVPYILTGVLPSFFDALFESVSGFTTTGATVITDIDELAPSVLYWRSLTHWLGGMGIIVLGVAILPLLGVGGMAMFKAEVPSPVMDKVKPTVAETAKSLWRVYVVLTVIETVLLLVAGMSFFDSVCHTFGTLATGGFSTKNLSIGYYDSVWIHVIIIVFMMAAGINFTLHYQALQGQPKAYLHSFELRLYIAVFVIATVFITANIFGNNYDTLSDSVVAAAFQSAAIMTTTGYGTADWEQWPWACQWLLLCLMFMGGCAGSTGGGMKCMRLIIVGKHVLRELRLLIHPRAVIHVKIDKKVIQPPIINSVLAFIGLFIATWTASTLLLVIMDIDVITAVGATTATLSNIGPGLNMVGAADTYAWVPLSGKILLIFNMLAGRLELYTVFVLMVPDFWRN